MTDRPYNAANRKHIRAAEKALVATDAINRDVISGLMSVQNGRHWVYDQLASAYVFADPFTLDPYAHAYHAGTRAEGIKLFNSVMLYAPAMFVKMIEEANERAATADARRSNADASADSDTEPGPDSVPDAVA